MTIDDFAGLPGVGFVSGGTGGIGAEVCRTLAARGSDVAFTYGRSHDRAAALVEEIEGAGRRAAAWSVDLLDEDGVVAAIGEIVERFGGIHSFVHAAGPHVPQIHLSKVSPSQFRESLDQEAAGFFTLVHTVLPHLRAAAGSIVAVTSAAPRRFPVRDGLSSVPKASVEGLVRAIAVEEGRFGIRANSVGPGMLTDGMAERLISSGDLGPDALDAAMRNIPLRKFGRATDIAEAVCFLASSRAGFISGQALDVDGGFSA
ncbi:3-oxoacyl-ACP reductase FabG [soil metagenome]